MTKKPKIQQKDLVARMDKFEEEVAAIHQVLLQMNKPGSAPFMHVLRRARRGDGFPRYTYEGTQAKGQLDPWFRRSPPATE